MTIRAARKNDCAELAELVDIAGEGLPYYHWQQVASPARTPGKSAASARPAKPGVSRTATVS